MRKFITLLLLTINTLLLCSFGIQTAHASYKLTTYVYARAETSGVMLYKTPSITTEDNIYFEIPRTYFVLLISNFTNEFYKAQYRDVVGYVIKTSVSPVQETPESPYLTSSTFRVFSNDGKNMLTSPFSSKNPTIVKTVELYDNIDYYGICYGDELIKDRGDEWIYGKSGDVFGYLYKGLCDNISNIQINNEVTTTIQDPFATNDNDYLYNLIDLSIGMKIFLIALVSIPAILLIIMLFRPYRLEKLRNKVKKPKKFKGKVASQIQEMGDENF